jgi:hypothetical protein
MADSDIRVEIGFQGGLILSLRLAPGEWKKLEAALQNGDSRVALTGEDEETTHVQLSRVCYVKHEGHVGRVGF